MIHAFAEPTKFFSHKPNLAAQLNKETGMTKLSTMTIRHFIRPVIGLLTITLALTVLFVWSRTATTAEAQETNDETTRPRTETITATFPANAASLGAIPDNPGAGCGAYAGAIAKDVTYTVTGISGTITDVRVSATYSPAHTWGGDLSLELRSPGASPLTKFIHRNRGSTTATGCGSANDLAGPYNFFDTGLTTFNTVAGTPTPAGDYQANTPCGVAGCGTATPITPTFASLGSGANGTWTLQILDGGAGDIGSISASVLTITTAGPPPNAPADFNGDGKTDWAVVRDRVPGTPGSQVDWYLENNALVDNPGAEITGTAWGIDTDFFVTEDFDGDGRDDIAVWRPGAATVAAFYILQSSNNTLKLEVFGQTGDDPSVVDDYDGDGRADPAVYRAGAANGQSTWFYRGSMNNPSGNITFVPWGLGNDFPAPGDFDGDGRADFATQRGPSPATFWIRLATGTISTVVHGLSTDLVVPGDYDNDGRTDIATVRNQSGTITWYIRQSSNGATIGGIPFGTAATDLITQGDYDGDRRTDLAVWRNNGTFWVLRSSNNAVVTFGLGANGDYLPANYNVH
jgi:hypothetical protein